MPREGHGPTTHNTTQEFKTKHERNHNLLFVTSNFKKESTSCILEGHFSTKPVSSTPHFQGPKSNTCVHHLLINIQLTRISL